MRITHDITRTYGAPTARIGRFIGDDRGSWAKADWWKSNAVAVNAKPGERIRVLYTPGMLAWQMKLTLAE